MKTNFFEHLAALQINGNLLLNINTNEKGIMTVSAILKTDRNENAAKGLPPMLFKGTAQELDEGFLAGLAEPVRQTIGLLTNIEAYQKELEKAKKNAKPAKTGIATPEADTDGDDNDDTETLFTPKADDKEAKAEKKRLYDEAIDRAKELAKQMKYAEALAQLPDVADYPEKAEILAAKRQEIQAGKDLYDKLAQQFND